MTEPLSNKVQLTAYAGVQGGVIKSPTDKAYTNSGAILGGEINYKGTFLRGQVEAGTALGGKLELGHTFDIGRNMGLELSAKAQFNKSLIGNNTYNASADVVHNYDLNVTDNQNAYLVNVTSPVSSDFSTSWKGGETRIGLGAKYTFGSNKVKFGIGAEAGFRKGNQPNMTYTLESNSDMKLSSNENQHNYHQEYSSVVVEGNNSGFYATPTVSADIKLNNHLSLNANADLQQGQLGVRWNF